MADNSVVKNRFWRLAIRWLATAPLVVLLVYSLATLWLTWAGANVPYAFHQTLVGLSIAVGFCVFAFLFAWSWDGFEPAASLDECPHAIPACDSCRNRIMRDWKIEKRPPNVNGQPNRPAPPPPAAPPPPRW